MATLTCTARFDSRALDLYGFIADSELSNQTPTGFRATFGAGDYVDFKGVGYEYFGPEPFQGTTKQATVFIDNAQAFKLSGLNITIDDVLRYADLTARQVAAEIFNGNDKINGSNKNDYLEGFDGNDTYTVENAGDKVIERANDGDDTVLATVDYRLANGVHVENLTAASGRSAIDLTGNAFAQTIKGNAGNNDIDGGGGGDVLSGGRGIDTFEFRATLKAGNAVEITDYDIGPQDDKIELSRADFRGLDLGRLEQDDFAEHFTYNRATGKLSFDANGDDRPGGGVHFATFTNKADITFDDFFIVA